MNRRKPSHLKLLSGTSDAGREGVDLTVPTVDELPDAPDYLDIEGAKEWRRVARILSRAKVLSDADFGVLSAYCAAHSAMVRSLRASAPLSAAVLTQYRLLAAECGLTLRSRSGLLPSGGGGNRFQKFKPQPVPPKAPTRRSSRK